MSLDAGEADGVLGALGRRSGRVHPCRSRPDDLPVCVAEHGVLVSAVLRQ